MQLQLSTTHALLLEGGGERFRGFGGLGYGKYDVVPEPRKP